MKTLLESLKTAARIGYVIAAWVLVAMVVVQVFHAGVAVLVRPGDWAPHTSFGSVFSLPVMLMFILSLAGWMPVRFFLLSLGLYALYMLQYLLIYLPGQAGLPALSALHPVNALAILLTAKYAAQSAWQLVTAAWPPGLSARRLALITAVVIGALWTASAGLQFQGWNSGAATGAKTRSLADATESSVPQPYREKQSPISEGDGKAVAAGQQIVQQKCISCHAADLKGKQLGNVRSADLTRSAETRSDQFLMWAVSEGSDRGMPAWKSGLNDEERWQVVTYIKSLNK